MVTNRESEAFGKLFREYRKKAGYSTLGHFADALAQAGYTYEDSIFSHWQAGRKIPQDRKLLVAVLKLFVQRGAIKKLDDLNRLMEYSGNGFLTTTEILEIGTGVMTKEIFQVPRRIKHFTGREQQLKKITQSVLKNKIVLLSGLAGAGKTSLAIEASYVLRNKFKDGVIWLRVDTSDAASILGAIAREFGDSLDGVSDIKQRASIVRSLLADKQVLIIYDNAEVDTEFNLLLPNSSKAGIIVTSRSMELPKLDPQVTIKLDHFSKSEALALWEIIVGRKELQKHKKNIEKILARVGHLPLVVNMLAKQVHAERYSVDRLLKELSDDKLRFTELVYDDKDLFSSFDLSYNRLGKHQQSVFVHIGVFAGEDFHAESVAYLSKLPVFQVKEILRELIDYSLVEISTIKGKYRTHPVVRLFTISKLSSQQPFVNGSEYYCQEIEKIGPADMEIFDFVRDELDNIVYLFKKMYQLREYKLVIRLWDNLSTYLYDTGELELLRSLGLLATNAAAKSKDKESQAIIGLREINWSYYWQLDTDTVEKYIAQAQAIFDQTGNDLVKAYIYQRQGALARLRHKLPQAEKLLKEAELGLKKYKREKDRCNTLVYLMHVLIELGKLQEAEECAISLLEIAKTYPESHDVVPMAYESAGTLYIYLEDFKKSEEYLQKALSLASSHKLNEFVMWSIYTLALLEVARGNTKQAKIYKKEADIIAKKFGFGAGEIIEVVKYLPLKNL